MSYLSADELLAGAALTHDVEIPAELAGGAAGRKVRLRPLTVRDLQRVAKGRRTTTGCCRCCC